MAVDFGQALPGDPQQSGNLSARIAFFGGKLMHLGD